MGACFRYDLGVLRETAVAHIQAWRVRMSVGLFPDGGAPLVGCEESLLLDGDFRLGVVAAHFLVADFTEICEVPREATLNGGPLGSHGCSLRKRFLGKRKRAGVTFGVSPQRTLG